MVRGVQRPGIAGTEFGEAFYIGEYVGGIKGNGKESIPPEETKPPFKYVGILDSTSLEDWNQDRNSKTFKEEFFPQWFSKWVADFYVLAGMEVFEGQSD